MRRILVIGPSGAGKTTLARKIAARRGLPHYDLDYYHWRPGWTAPPKEEWRATAERLAAAPEWVMSGNYGGSFDVRMPRAETIIWLDFPRRLCLARIFWRMTRDYGRTREGMADGCPERIDLKFLHYAWTFNKVHRPRILAALERYALHARLFHCRDDDASRVLSSMGHESLPDRPCG
jgi:adenylate kinase family enzyme